MKVDLEEEWKIIENFSNYRISNTGLVKNFNTNHILKPTIIG